MPTTKAGERFWNDRPVLNPDMDMSVYRGRLPEAVNEKLYGVDGRFLGSLRNFPGMRKVSVLGGGHLYVHEEARYIDVKAAGSIYRIRGFIWLNASGQLSFTWFYTEGEAWYTTAVATGVTEGQWDVVTQGSFAYIVARDVTPKTIIGTYDSDAGGVKFVVSVVDMGLTDANVEPTAPTRVPGSDATTGGHLRDGEFRIAYRLVDSDRSLKSGLSVAQTVIVDDDTGTSQIAIRKPTTPGGEMAGADSVEIYRTLSFDIAGSAYAGGVFYREQLIDYSTTWLDSEGGTPIMVGSLTDLALTIEESYDPYIDEVGAAPNSDIVGVMGNVTIVNNTEEDEFRWSNLDKDEPEVFRAGNTQPLSSDDGSIRSIVGLGATAWVLCENCVYRLLLQGSRLVVDRLHEGFGLSSRGGATVIGNEVVYITEHGLAVLSSPAGKLTLLNQVARLIMDSWKSSLNNVKAATDYGVGMSFFVNRTLGEAIVLTHTTKKITLLADCDYSSIVEGVEPEDPGAQRAFFTYGASGRIVTPNTILNGNPTMSGCDVVNGTATGGTTTTVVDTSKVFGSQYIGSRIRFLPEEDWLDSDGIPRSVIITGATGDTLTFEPALDDNVVAGTRYTVSPVVFEMAMSPVQAGDEFGRKMVSSLGLATNITAGITSNVNAYWRLMVESGFGGTDQPSSRKNEEVAMGQAPEDMVAHLPLAGVCIQPKIRCVSAGVRFELTGIQITGTISPSRRQKAVS